MSCADIIELGTRVVMNKEHRWQGVGTVTRIHDNASTCAVKWDSGRLDRSIKISDLILKKVGGSSASLNSSFESVPEQSPSRQQQPETPENDRTLDDSGSSSPVPSLDFPPQTQSASQQLQADEGGQRTDKEDRGSPLFWMAVGAVGGAAFTLLAAAAFTSRNAISQQISSLKHKWGRMFE